MVIVINNESLKISNFYLLFSTFTFKQGIQLKLWLVTIVMTLKQFLNDVNTLEVIRSRSQYFKGLFFSNKSTFYSEPFFSNLFATLVAVFFHLGLHSFLL